MKEFASIEQRYGYSIPALYRQLDSQGRFDYRREPRDWLSFYDCEWLSLERMATYEFNSWMIAADGGFVPFAITGRHEPYCWRMDWAVDGNEPPIVICEQSEKAICLAPNFGGFLYRLAIEAFAGRNDIASRPSSKDELLSAVDILIGVLPPSWSARLLDLRTQPWKTDETSGNIAVLSWAEGGQIIRTDLSFPHLNERFIHDKDYLKRLQNKK